MRRDASLGRSLHVGIALGPDRLAAVAPRLPSDAPWVSEIAPWSSGGTSWPDLAAALRALRAAVGDDGSPARRFAGVLHIALLPPLADLRRVELAGLSAAEARKVVRREPSRYLPVPPDGLPMEVEIEGDGWRGMSPFTLVAAPRALVEGIYDAARESGWRVAEIVPAHTAWAAAASSLSPRSRHREHTLLIRFDGLSLILRVRADRVLALRRLPSAAPEAISSAIGALGNDDGEQHADKTTAAPIVTLAGESAITAAARFAPRAAGPALLPDAMRVGAERRTTRFTLLRFFVAAALLFIAAGAELWGTSRERATVAALRARLADQVSRATATRDSLMRASDRLATIRAASSGATRWSALIAALAAELPVDAYLLSLRADADTLRLEGSSVRAARVFEAVGQLRGVRLVWPDGPIRQEVSGGRPPVERFTMSALLGGEP